MYFQKRQITYKNIVFEIEKKIRGRYKIIQREVKVLREYRAGKIVQREEKIRQSLEKYGEKFNWTTKIGMERKKEGNYII